MKGNKMTKLGNYIKTMKKTEKTKASNGGGRSVDAMVRNLKKEYV